MRVTNQMMTNSMLSHINQNKINLSALENQYSTGKKILKPSDDPIIAVRALKLRSNLGEITQYLDRNIPDAESWMDVTESALKNVNNVLTKINSYCVQGSTDTLTATNRADILKNLEQLKQQIYQEGNSQYAGRYVFTGFKTDTPLLFDKETKYTDENYNIKETFTKNDIHTYTTIDTPENEGTAPKKIQTNRIQLSYKDIAVTSTTDPVSGEETLTSSLTTINYKVNDVAQTPIGVTKTVKSTTKGAYEPGENEVYLLADTGEIVMGDKVAETLSTASEISMSYDKKTFAAGDLRPEHYFECTFTPKTGSDIVYKKEKQDITYEINFGQSLKINTEAKDAFGHEIGRLIDDITTIVTRVNNIEKEINSKKEQLKTATGDEKVKIETKIDQLETALSLNKSIMQETFSASIKKTQGFEDKVNVSLADLGSRSNRLDLTKTRLEDQQVELEELKSSNEDADLVETVIRYKSAESIYTSSLTAAGSVIKTNLLNFL